MTSSPMELLEGTCPFKTFGQGNCYCDNAGSHDAPDLAREVAELREVVSQCAAAIGTAAFCRPDASVEFMQSVPAEIASTTASLRQIVGVMRGALAAARPRIAHTVKCLSVPPAAEWAEKGSAVFDKCSCEIAVVDAAIAQSESVK